MLVVSSGLCLETQAVMSRPLTQSGTRAGIILTLPVLYACVRAQDRKVQYPWSGSATEGLGCSMPPNDGTIEHPFNGIGTDSFRVFQSEILNAGAGKTRGAHTYSDHLLGIDMGGPAGPPIAGAGAAKRRDEFSQRQKESYSLVVNNITDSTLREVLRTGSYPIVAGGAPAAMFQNGRAV